MNMPLETLLCGSWRSSPRPPRPRCSMCTACQRCLDTLRIVWHAPSEGWSQKSSNGRDALPKTLRFWDTCRKSRQAATLYTFHTPLPLVQTWRMYGQHLVLTSAVRRFWPGPPRNQRLGPLAARRSQVTRIRIIKQRLSRHPLVQQLRSCHLKHHCCTMLYDSVPPWYSGPFQKKYFQRRKSWTSMNCQKYGEKG